MVWPLVTTESFIAPGETLDGTATTMVVSVTLIGVTAMVPNLTEVL